MSADNWAICPVCHKKWVAPTSLYGKVSEDEYKKSLEKPPVEEEPTMREDYEIGTDETGVLVISYRCSCTVCGFRGVFETTHQFDTKQPQKGKMHK